MMSIIFCHEVDWCILCLIIDGFVSEQIIRNDAK